MPRIARQKHDTAVYHIMIRGNNRERIFFGDEDRSRFFNTIRRYMEKFQFILFAYCLMDNHVHMLIHCNGQDISKVMQGINLSYTLYINRKYERCGHLFQGRFKSIIAKRDCDIINETKYIHRNPVRAGITQTACEYKWSSINVYKGEKDEFGIINEDFVLQYYNSNKSKAREAYIKYVEDNSKEVISKIEEDSYVSSDIKPVIELVDINKVLLKVSNYFGVCIDDIILRGNKRFAQAKQLATYIISLKSKLQYREIGQKFGICASAVGHNIKKAIETVMLNRELANELTVLFS